MSALFEIARNVLAVIGLLAMLALTAVAVLLVQISVENRARRLKRQRKESAAVDQLRTDIVAFELLTSARDVWGDDDDRG